MTTVDRTVVMLAGRRIDPVGALGPVFPAGKVETVRSRIESLLRTENAVGLVSSAACGADLLGQGVAGDLGLRRRIVLPFAPARFRKTSVIDRPGAWGRMFDRVLAAVRADGGLVVLGVDGRGAFTATNEGIFREAQEMAADEGAHRLLAVVVWDGMPHPDGDVTDAFRRIALASGLETRFVSTVE